jgi:DNA repair protein SbcD/Mre11
VRLVHLSDLHLGFRAFPRRERGWNLRERDLATTFHRAIQEIARHDPAVVLLSGDLFDHPDPPSTAFLTLSRGLTTLRGLLPEVTVLAIAGERDTPLTPADPGPVAVVDALPGVEAAAGAPRAVHLRDRGIHALLVPHRAILRPPFPEMRPDPDARFNLLLVRGVPAGAQDGAGLPRVASGGWDYIALGGPHGHRSWGERVWSAGSLDRVGGDPWSEATEEKGFVVFDLERGEGEFHPVPGRPVVDLAPVRVDPMDREAGGRRLRELLDGIPGGIDGKIVRLRFRGEVDAPLDGLPPGLLRAVERRAAHLEIGVDPTGVAPVHSPRAPESPGKGALELSWEGGGAGEVTLAPGLWALTGDSVGDRNRLVEAVRRAVEEVESHPSSRDQTNGASQGNGDGEAAGRREGGRPHPGGWNLRLKPPGPIRLLHDGLVPPPEGGDGDAPPSSGASSSPASTSPTPSSSAPASPPRGDPLLRGALREARADWVEAAGELEARTMEWTRERQEAETRLRSYRDRARELRQRIRVLEQQGADAVCPTCSRPLKEAHPELTRLLREEWEAVVQDGRWWKRRREQLEDRPQDLRELEREALRIHARVEALSQEEGSGAAPRIPVESAPEAGSRPDHRPGSPPWVEVPSPGRLRRAGEVLRRVSEGEVQGVRWEDGAVALLRDDGEASPPTPDENALLAAALLLAGLHEGGGGWEGPGDRLALVTSLSGTEGDPRAVRILELLAATPLELPVLVVLAPGLLARCPELFQGIVEVHRDEDGRVRGRSAPAGRARIHLVSEGQAARGKEGEGS